MLVPLLVVTVAAHAAGITDEEYSRFPRLYHLDEYEGCLARPGGLYCLGTFHLAPASHPHRVYDLMKEYSKDPNNFNRTLLHRGYCVSDRCPKLSSERNTTLRFERCIAKWARTQDLRTSLHKLKYCKNHQQHYVQKTDPEPQDISHRVMIYIVMALLVCNAIGTCFDALTEDSEKKNKYLVAWSLRSNWRRLTATYEDGDPRLSALLPVQGVRVLLMALIMMTHVTCIHVMLYNYNPRFIEEASHMPWVMVFLNGTSVVQIFMVVSSFLLTYNMLLYSKLQPLSLRLLPLCIIKRVIRISPVYLLVVGYAATWWPRARGGPMWPSLVGAESAVCRTKFWTHALFINNLVDPQDQCLVQTWFLAVDMQLYIVSSALTLVLWKLRSRALCALGALLAAACLANGALVYLMGWQSMIYYVYPENLSNMYHGIPSFSWLYMSPWGSLPAALLGQLLGHLHYELQERGFKVANNKWVVLTYHWAVPLIVSWTLTGGAARAQTGAAAVAYTVLERPVVALLAAVMLFTMFNGVDGFWTRMFAWRGWHAMGRMSLAVLMVHWCVATIFAASRPQPLSTNLMEIAVDWLATGVLSYLVAIPVTIMVEMPVQRFLNAVIF